MKRVQAALLVLILASIGLQMLTAAILAAIPAILGVLFLLMVFYVILWQRSRF